MTDEFEDIDTEDEISDEAQEWIETCGRIMEDCEDVPERAEEFASLVFEKIESMMSWVEQNRRITPAMIQAIENIDEALQKLRGNA